MDAIALEDVASGDDSRAGSETDAEAPADELLLDDDVYVEEAELREEGVASDDGSAPSDASGGVALDCGHGLDDGDAGWLGLEAAMEEAMAAAEELEPSLGVPAHPEAPDPADVPSSSLAAAGSSASAVAPAPPPLAPKSRALAAADFPAGRISFYRSGDFVAECGRRAVHGVKCRLTRTSRGSAVPGREAKGRPLGALLAWLDCPACVGSQYEHVHQHWPTLVQREAAREVLAASTDPNAVALLGHERPRRDGEPPEPVGDPEKRDINQFWSMVIVIFLDHFRF